MKKDDIKLDEGYETFSEGPKFEFPREIFSLTKESEDLLKDNKDNKDKQMEVFEHQLNIAEKLNLPVVIHSREAAGDTLEILKKHHNFGVIHSFSGSLEMAKEYIKLGFVLGVNGVVTFKNCNLGDTLKNIDINSIILETDSPYLTPVPFRGTQNNPGKMINTAKFVADIYGVSLSELAKITNQNIKRIFIN